MLSDDSSVLASATFSVDTGFSVIGGSPSQFSGANWLSVGSVPASTVGDETLDGFVFRVAPSGGSSSWSVTVDAQQRGDWFFAVGSLFGNSSEVHGPVILSASESSSDVAVELLSTSGWSSGAGSLIGDLDWNPSASALTPLAANNGESGFAFFQLENFGGDSSSFTFDIPSGFSSGAAGDDVVFAVGFAVPEPSVAGLVILSFLGLLRRQR